MPQPQKRRSHQPPRTAMHRAASAELARRQHAERRGWEIRPDLRDQYRKAYRNLLRSGVSRATILDQLRPLYAKEGRQ